MNDMARTGIGVQERRATGVSFAERKWNIREKKQQKHFKNISKFVLLARIEKGEHIQRKCGKLVAEPKEQIKLVKGE